MSILAKATPTTSKVASASHGKNSFGFKPAPNFHAKAK
jgi:hypothetical protein